VSIVEFTVDRLYTVQNESAKGFDTQVARRYVVDSESPTNVSKALAARRYAENR